MTNRQKTFKRYSISFKQKVVREIEEEGLSVSDARRRYDIGGAETIQVWLRKFGKTHLLSTVTRIEMKHESDRLRELEKEVQKLKVALADSVLANDANRNLIRIAGEHYGVDLKKSFGGKPSDGPTR